MHVGVEVLVAASAEREGDDVVGTGAEAGQDGKGVGRLEGGDDALKAGELESGAESFVVGDGVDRGAAAAHEVGVHGAHTGVVEPGGQAVGFADLAVGVLKDKGAAAVEHAGRAGCQRGGCLGRMGAGAAGLGEDKAYAPVVGVVVEGAGGVGPAADAGDEVVGAVISSLMTLCRRATRSG